MRVIAGRSDGLGTRLLTFMAARFFAEAANCPISFIWPSIDDPLYTSRSLLRFEAVSEVFQRGSVFTDLSPSQLRERGDTDGLRVFAIHSVLHHDGILSLEQVLELAKGYEVILYDMPFVIADGEGGPPSRMRYMAYWQAFNFAEAVTSESRRIRSNFANPSFAAIHMRRGDTQKMLASSSLEFLLHVGFRQLFQRYLPIKQAVSMIAQYLDEPMPIVVVSEDATVSQKVAMLLPKYNVSGTTGVFPHDSNEQALLDLILIADAKVLLSPSTSFFSECAAKVGNGLNVRADIEINLLVDELFPLLDVFDQPDASLRKAALLDIAFAVMHEASDADFANMRVAADLYRPAPKPTGEIA